ncbi:MAG: hypothetical protein PHG39_07865 [Acidithiobacillus ferrooxidans]|nr:hypothetical protein [Acidithiobacillus ferrooxidans]MDD5004335.1 hypothetical protein [Acidithiobacillus sp.]MDD5378870.1 hypothetical protein [Acidithiobacillus sp.]MDD5575451.1 hypothetical protein [Acidithiobacillus sp.]
MSHWLGPYSWLESGPPQQARLFKFFEGGLAPNYFRYVIASVLEIINIFDRTHPQVQVRGS